MNIEDKILQCNNRINDLTKTIEDFKRHTFQKTGEVDESEWSEADRGKLYSYESKLRDAKISLQKVRDEIDKNNLKKDHRTGKFVRI
ncbi:MAG: hypothetical protein ACPG5T_01255 [Endozoicomonas sp.]